MGPTRGICAVVGDVIVSNSGEIGHPGKATASCSSIKRAGGPLLTLALLGGCLSFWSGRSHYERYKIMCIMAQLF